MQYDVLEVDMVNLKQALNKLKTGDEVIAVNYIGTLKNQIVIRKNLVRVDELKTREVIPVVKHDDKTNRKRKGNRARK